MGTHFRAKTFTIAVLPFVLLVFIIALLAFSKKDDAENTADTIQDTNPIETEAMMTEDEARAIAENAETCMEVGTLADSASYNPNSRTWWFDLERTPEVADGCSPACVVWEETLETEVNWRCTGLIQDTP